MRSPVSRCCAVVLPFLALAAIAIGCGGEGSVPGQGPLPPVEVLTVEPADGALGVAVSALVRARLSREIRPAQMVGLGLGLFLDGAGTGGQAQARATLLRDRRTVVLSPLEDLQPSAGYEIRGGGRRLAGFGTAPTSAGATTVRFGPHEPGLRAPYPSDWLCAEDPSTPTGLRLDIPEEDVFFNIRPSELRKGDGFAPFPRITVPLTGPVAADLLPGDEAASVDALGGLLLLNVDAASEGYGERVPFLARLEPFGLAMREPAYALLVSPFRPLDTGTRYALVVTRRLTDPQGAPVEPSDAFRSVLEGEEDPALRRAREVVAPVLAVLESPDVEMPLLEKDLSLILPFTVRSEQSLAGDLVAIRDYLLRVSPASPPVMEITSDSPEPPEDDIERDHIARFVAGTVACPDFRGEDGLFDEALVQERPDDAPRVPLEFILTIPVAAEPGNPAGVVLVLHGINSFKERLYDIADGLAERNLAGIAIDIVEHGSRGTAPDDLAWIPFLRIEDLAVGRDNMRQTQADLLCLTRAVLNSLTPALGEPLLDTERPLFIGTSLGGILGTAYLALEPAVNSGVLFVTGGGMTEVALQNPMMQPGGPLFNVVLLLLERAGDAPSDGLYGLLNQGQEIVDTADPLAFAGFVNGPTLAAPASPKDVLLLEVMDDDTIPNPTTGNLARALRLEMVRPVLERIEGVPETDAPLVANGPNGRTAGLAQFDWITVGGERVPAQHSALFNSEEGHRMAGHFLETSRRLGRGEVLAPYPAGR